MIRTISNLTMNNKHYIKNSYFITLIIVLIFSSVVFISYTWSKNIGESEDRAKQLALASEAGFQKSSLYKLNANESDLHLHEYREIKSSLINLVEQMNEIRFAYIYIQRNGKIYFLADSEPPDSEDYSPPGQEYWEADDDSFLPFLNGQPLITKPTTDRWGTWISILVPMKDIETGEVIAVFGVDYPAESWNDYAVARTIHMGIMTFCVLIILLTLYFAFFQNIELRKEKKKLLDLDSKLKESEMLFRTIFNQAPIGIAIGHNYNYSELNGNRASINPMFEKITGRTQAELVGISWKDITHPDDLEENLENYSKFRAGENNGYEMEKRYIKPDGSEVWVKMIIAPLEINNTTIDYNLCLIEDISNRKKTEKALFDSERSKAVLLDNLPGMAYRSNYDYEWTMQFVSKGCFELTGYQPESLLFNNELSYKEIIVPEFRDILWTEWGRVLALQIPFRFEYEIISGEGKRKWVLEMGQGIYDESGNVDALEGIVIDITEQKEREAQIQYINDHDFMTGLYNRKYFEEVIVTMNSEDCFPLSIIIADINGVRLINDAFGFSEGDKLLKETSKILQSSCRPGDFLARVGGDEFGILLPNTDSDKAYEMMNVIQRACNSYNKINKAKLYEINLSMGYATKETKEGNVEEFLKLADEFLRNRKLLNRKSFHSNIISSMMATVYEKSQETEEHAKRLSTFSKIIGEKLNLSQKNLGELELLAMLHDIGKVGIDDGILNKPGKLDEAEWVIMKRHPEIGYRIAKSTSELEPIAEYILSHHERWDGRGYPQGLKGEVIPILSRIIAVADAYDAMTEDRIYRKAMTKEEAIEEIRRNAGTQFDPKIAQLFIENLL